MSYRRKRNYRSRSRRVSVSPHNRRWPFARKPQRVHVVGHNRNWPVTGGDVPIRAWTPKPKQSSRVLRNMEDTPQEKSSAEMRAEARETAAKRPWEMTRSQFLAVGGAPTSGVCLDASPMQISRMSKRQKDRWWKSRQGDYAKRGQMSDVWEKSIIDAYEKGEVTYEDVKQIEAHGMNDTSPKSVILRHERRKREAKEKRVRAERDNYRMIRRVDEIKVGDTIQSRVYGKLKVKKINRKSVVTEGGRGGGTLKLELWRFERGHVWWPEERSVKAIGERRHMRPKNE